MDAIVLTASQSYNVDPLCVFCTALFACPHEMQVILDRFSSVDTALVPSLA